MISNIKQIVTESIQAPSGHNYQPWKFKLKKSEDILEIYNVPQADTTIYNYKQRGSYISIGALIENINVVSSKFGLISETILNQEGDCLARIKFMNSKKLVVSPLYDSISKRSTNRLPYKKKSLDNKHLNILQDIEKNFSDVSLFFLQDRKKIDQLSSVFSLNEFLLLSNETMHKSLFPHIVWDRKTFYRNRNGLYVETMGLNPVAKFLFKKASNWNWARKAQKFKFPQFVAKQNAITYRSCSVIGLISIKDLKRSHFIQAGRLFQRVWLSATKYNINLQPLAAVIYLASSVRDGEDKIFDLTERENILSGYNDIRNAFRLNDNEQIVMTFRIGYGIQPNARSVYLEPKFEYA